MVFGRVLRHPYSVLLLSSWAGAYNCSGNSFNYNESSIFVPFKNLCGQDISAASDTNTSSDILPNLSRENCQRSCVTTNSICYGFDWREENKDKKEGTCFLMRLAFQESETTKDSNAYAAMVLPDFVSKNEAKCAATGWRACLQSQISITSSSISPTTSPTPASSTAAPDSVESKSGLSSGAKAGIAAGIGIAALLGIIAAVYLLLRRRSNRGTHTEEDEHVGVERSHRNDKHGAYSDYVTARELEAPHSRAELDGRQERI